SVTCVRVPGDLTREFLPPGVRLGVQRAGDPASGTAVGSNSRGGLVRARVRPRVYAGLPQRESDNHRQRYTRNCLTHSPGLSDHLTREQSSDKQPDAARVIRACLQSRLAGHVRPGTLVFDTSVVQAYKKPTDPEEEVV